MAEMIYDLEQAKSIDTPDLLKELKTDTKSGLSEKEVNGRLESFGYNEIVEKKESLLLRFLKNFWGPIPWMIEAAVILSIIDKDWTDVIIIGSLLLLNGLIEFVQGYKADNAMAMLKKSLASMSRVLRDGKWKELEARELVPGDIIRIRLGDIIPADVKLFDGEYLILDESALTGESLPVEKHAGDIAYSGSVAKQGEMNAVVYGT
ncbi:MAG: HAD-IC family P-type ATPase, partial [Bacteroidales bacterium]|nr:HAD-IC family P-type ATPase [Bacteroidales bacterium]